MPHPRLTTLFDVLQMLLSAIVGWAPALARIVISFVVTLLLVPRLDLKLPGASLDGSYLKFRGVFEGSRMQTEYRIVAEHVKEMKRNAEDTDVVLGNPAFDVEDAINISEKGGSEKGGERQRAFLGGEGGARPMGTLSFKQK